MSDNYVSEVAYFREQQALQEEAARLGLAGYAITTRHDFITARMQQGGKRILQLFEEGKTEEAFALWDTQSWEVGEPGECEKQAEKQDGTAGQRGRQAEQEHGETWQEERKEDEPAEPAH